MSPFNKQSRVLVCGIVLSSLSMTAGIATAQTPSSPEVKPSTLPTGAKSQTKAELDAIRTQNALDAERQKGIKGGSGALAQGPNVPSISAEPIPVMGSGNRNSSSAGANSARVTMVAGPVGQLVATIQTHDGLVAARIGDKLAGVGVIKHISVNQVTADDGKRQFSIPFAAEPTSNLIASPAGSLPLNWSK